MVWRLFSVLLIWIAWSANASQRSQLLPEEVDGNNQWETPGFYALLNTAAAWDAEASLMPRAGDLAILEKTPDQYRGEVFALSGYLQQVERFSLRRPSAAYGAAVTRWVLLLESEVQTQTQPDSDDPVALVYLVDPDGQHAAARTSRSRRVRVEGQFLKVLSLPAQTGQEERFPAFVGRVVDATFLEGSPSSGNALPWIVGGVATGLGLWWWARSRSKRLAPSVRRRTIREPGDTPEQAALVRSDLPEDPADALAALAEEARHPEA